MVLRSRWSVASGLTSLALLVAAASPAGALAAGLLPILPDQTTPTQSFNVVGGITSVSFKVVAPTCPGAPMYVEVASQEVYGPDGTFADAVQADRFSLVETSPGIYEGQTSAQWLKTPATYFWMASAVVKCEDVFDVPRNSPVRSLIVTVPPPPPAQDAAAEAFEDSELLTIAQAKAEVPNIILKRTKKVARGLKRKCSRRGEGSVLVVACTVAWNDNKKYRYDGSMRLARNDDGTLSVRFDGRRALSACTKKGGGKRCYKKFAFSYDAA